MRLKNRAGRKSPDCGDWPPATKIGGPNYIAAPPAFGRQAFPCGKPNNGTSAKLTAVKAAATRIRGAISLPKTCSYSHEPILSAIAPEILVTATIAANPKASERLGQQSAARPRLATSVHMDAAP